MTESPVSVIQPSKTLLGRFRGWISYTFPPVIAFLAIDLALTLIFFGVSSPSTHIGTLRPVSTIAPKLLELALVGLGVGLVSCLALRKFDFGLVSLGVAFVALLDLDHLPAVFGVDQPIRPAHSLAFILVTAAILYFVAARGRPEIPIIFLGAFFAHMASDYGIFAMYAPFSFAYTSLNGLRIPFAFFGICLAILAGILKYQRTSKLRGKAYSPYGKESVIEKK